MSGLTQDRSRVEARPTSTVIRQPGTRFILWFSLPIAVGALGGALLGIFGHSAYARETSNWVAQAVAQDIANLVAYSALIVLAVLAARGALRAYLAWIGLLGYSVYTFAIYAFAVHFGPLFLLYVAVFVPSMLLAGALLLRRRAMGYVLTPLVLTAAFTISLGIIVIQPVSAVRGETSAWGVGAAVAVLAVVELLTLIRFLSAIEVEANVSSVLRNSHGSEATDRAQK